MIVTMTDVPLLPDQLREIDKFALKILAVAHDNEDDRWEALRLILQEYRAAVRAHHPDLSNEQVMRAVARLGDLIVNRIEEIQMSSGEGGTA